MTNLRDGMDEIRLFLRNVKPDRKSINIQDIRELLNKFQYQTSIKTSLTIDGSLEKVKDYQFNAILQCIKETLTNTCKYGDSTEIKINIFSYSKILRVNMKNNGTGCKKIIKGLGLRGIEERIEKIHGKVSFSGDNGFETNIIIILEG